MAKEIDKIIQSKTTPKSKNVLWDNGENLKINRKGKWESIGGGVPMLNVKYAELVDLHNNNKLIAGMQYRITDFVTTTTQENTRSAGHQFDIIVTADNENTLNEVARACLHEGDTYFSEAGANLAAWQIWYSLDNDTKRFGWADAENGKGVIYRMIDEWNNDIPYDFKNIIYIEKKSFKYTQWGGEHQFLRDLTIDKVIDGIEYYGYSSKTTPAAWSEGKCWVTDIEITSDTQLYKEDGSVISYDGTISNIIANDTEYYTFRKDNEDDSLYGITKDNVVKSGLQNGIQLLNKNIFGVGCYSNKLGNDSFNNTFGDNCYENTLLGGFIEERESIRYCANNSFGNRCIRNVFSYVAFGNTFGDDCISNSFGNKCYENIFNNGCCSNCFGDECLYNIFGEKCCYNTLGNKCTANNLSSNCYNNSFGNNCTDNSFSSECNHNSFGNECNSNGFGRCCKYNSFGEGCNYNYFSYSEATSTKKSYCSYNHLDEGCCYNIIWNSNTTNHHNQLQNINVNKGVSGTDSRFNFINIDIINANYEIQVAKNSSGEIKIYCEADLIV